MHKPSKDEIDRLIAQDAVRSTGCSTGHGAPYISYLNLTTALGAKPEPLPPKLIVTEAALAAVRLQIQARRELNRTTAVVWTQHRRGNGPAKRWPEERFTAAAIEIQSARAAGG